MARKAWIAIVAVCVFGARAISAPPLEAFGQLPTLSNVTLSPSGQLIAFVTTVGVKRMISIQPVGDTKPIAVLRLSDQKLRSLQWADDGHLLITTSETTVPHDLTGPRGEFFLALSYDLEKKSYRLLLKHAPTGITAMNVVTGVPQPRIIGGHTFVFVRGVYFPNKESRSALFRVDLTSGETEIVSGKRDFHGENWVVDEAGNVIAEAEYHESEQRWKLKLYRNGEPSNAIDVTAPIDVPQVEGLSEDGASLVIARTNEDGVPELEQVSLQSGGTQPWLHSGLRLEQMITNERTGRIIGGQRATDRTEYVFFDPHAEQLWHDLKLIFTTATDLKLVSWSEDMSKAVVLVFGPGYGDRYFFVDSISRRAVPIGPAYNGIEQFAPVKWISYRAGDGRSISAYLTLPIGREPKGLPLIVLPHGGPHSRDYPGFDWLSQALASRGYVVLQPQFRGSVGYGKDLLWAGFGEFGRKMQTDLSDGVRALAASSLIDPERVCIVGASYGGYAALAGATLETGVYRCAVSVAGVSDVRALMKSDYLLGNTVDASSQRFWYRFLNITHYDDPKLDAISPIKHVNQASIPILLIHGRDDTVVPFSQSDEMADALKDAGKQVEFVKLPGEDHWLSRSETRLQMLTAMVRFLEISNPSH